MSTSYEKTIYQLRIAHFAEYHTHYHNIFSVASYYLRINIYKYTYSIDRTLKLKVDSRPEAVLIHLKLISDVANVAPDVAGILLVIALLLLLLLLSAVGDFL